MIPEVRKLIFTQLTAAKVAAKSAILRQQHEDGSVSMMPLAVTHHASSTPIDSTPASPRKASSSSLPSSPKPFTEEQPLSPSADMSIGASRPVAADLPQVLQDISSWLLLQTCLSEAVQHHMLCEQHLGNVWRKVSFKSLLENYQEVGSQRCSEPVHAALEVFRERLDYQVNTRVDKMRAMAAVLLCCHSHSLVLSVPRRWMIE